MTLSVQAHMVNSGPEIYYGNKWVRTIYDHVQYLKQSQNTEIITVAPYMAQANIDNYVGLLNDLKIPPELHYVMCIVNGWEKAEEVGLVSQVFVPPTEELERIRKLLPST